MMTPYAHAMHAIPAMRALCRLAALLALAGALVGALAGCADGQTKGVNRMPNYGEMAYQSPYNTWTIKNCTAHLKAVDVTLELEPHFWRESLTLRLSFVNQVVLPPHLRMNTFEYTMDPLGKHSIYRVRFPFDAPTLAQFAGDTHLLLTYAFAGDAAPRQQAIPMGDFLPTLHMMMQSCGRKSVPWPLT